MPLWVTSVPEKRRAASNQPGPDVNDEPKKMKDHDAHVATGIQKKARPPAPGRGLPALAIRKDAPPVNFTSRGDPNMAIALTTSPADRAEALAEYRQDQYSSMGGEVRAATWSTWVKFHEHWHGKACPVLPLTAEKVEGY